MATPANDQIVEDAVTHAIWLMSYRKGLSNEFVRTLNQTMFPDLLAEINKRLESIAGDPRRNRQRLRLLDLARDVRVLQEEHYAAAYRSLKSELGSFARTEGEWTAKIITDAGAGLIASQLPTQGQFSKIITQSPMEGQVLRSWFQALSDSQIRGIRTQLQIGMSTGETVPEMTRRLTGTRARGFRDGIFGTTRHNAETIVRSVTMHVANQARQRTYEENAQLLQGVFWVSTLDSKTSLICIDLDGKTFPIDSGPRPPAHLNCRSTTVPVLKKWEELGIDAAEIPESTRASLNGQVPEKLTYVEWLRKQSSDFQIEVLGPGRARLFREGKIDRFTDRFLRPISLDELRRKSGL